MTKTLRPKISLLSKENIMDQTETRAEYWLILWRGMGAGGAERVAKTADYNLVKTIIEGLHTNRVYEDDQQDHVFDPDFIRSALAESANLTLRIRQAACQRWPDEVTRKTAD